jgi:IclR family acetate operon transcriptional repressor
MTKRGGQETPSIQSLDRGLSILEAVARSSSPVPLGQLTNLLGIDRSSVFRLANTLKRRGFLANPNGRKDYILGPSVWRLSRKYDWSMLISFCHERLVELARATGETAHLAVREGRQALFIDHHAATNQIIVVSGQTGEFVPLYCTAHGKALLADCGAAELKAIFGDTQFRAHTPRTATSIAELAAACGRIKADGYAFDDTEFTEEVRCMAAPVRDEDGKIVASIGISAPVKRFPRERAAEFARQVMDAAVEIGAVLTAAEKR